MLKTPAKSTVSSSTHGAHETTLGGLPPPMGEPYVVLRKDELIELLVRHGALVDRDAVLFHSLCRLIEAVFHQHYHPLQEQLKRLYAPFDPDAETRPLERPRQRPRREQIDEFLSQLADVLTAAHFRPLALEELEFALSGTTYWGLDLQINRDIFDRLMIYVRGDSSLSRVQRDLSTWFRQRTIDLEVFQRLVLVVKLRSDMLAGESVDTDSLHLKMFREIPKLDLEMLLPGTRPRIRLLDAGKIGGSSITGIFSLIKMAMETVFAGKLKWLMIGLGTLAYAFQSFLGYRRTKAAYLYSMTQQLYYQNLDNNAGVFCRLLDEAEDEDTKEAILAYFFLWRGSNQSWTPDHLGSEVDKLLSDQTGDSCCFQSREAIAKLQRLGLLVGDTCELRTIAPTEAIRTLSARFREHIGDG